MQTLSRCRGRPPETPPGSLSVVEVAKPSHCGAHPLEMQARSGRAERLFTPVQRLSTHGGFGRRGTSCKEYRHLARACRHVLDLSKLSESEAAQELRAAIEDLRAPDPRSPAERMGLLVWCDDWRHDFNADPKACEILVDAMARFMLHLKEGGASPRKISQVCGELNAAGCLVMSSDAPGRASFACSPKGLPPSTSTKGNSTAQTAPGSASARHGRRLLFSCASDERQRLLYAPMWHFLNFFPEPHGHGLFGPTSFVFATRRLAMSA